MGDLLNDMRDHLIAQGLVRRPRDATPDAPPLWLEPREGVPAPGEGQNATSAARTPSWGPTCRAGSRPARSSRRSADTVDIWLRTTSAARAAELQAQLRAALIDQRNWQMAGQLVIDCEEWRPLQRLGSDAQGYTFVWSPIFWLYA
jgi:hypothetical protein